MMKTGLPWAFALAVAAALFLVAGICQTAHALDCDGLVWQKTKNEAHAGVGYPETMSATYWTCTIDNRPGLYLMVSGRFPKARYMAYTLYDVSIDGCQGCTIEYCDEENNPDCVRRPQHLADEKIQPLEGRVNPYDGVADRDADLRAYRIWIIRSDSKLKDDSSLKNKLVIPNDIEKVSLFLRVYLPDNPAPDEFAVQGEEDLPSIQVFSENGEEPVCPEGLELGNVIDRNSIVKSDRLDPEGILLAGENIDKIESFKPGAVGLFPNGDAPYLVTPLVRPTLDHPKIAVLKFKAPNFPNTRGGDDFNENHPVDPDQVRYWSICMGDWASTQSSECIADQDVPLDKEGYVHLLIGPDGLVENDPDWINLKWTWPDTDKRILNPILMFRQISPRGNFNDNSFNAAEVAFNANGVEETMISIADLYKRNKQASLKIGEYAPTGTYCYENDFIKNRCGFDTSSADTTGGCN